ncbi:MAG: YciI family protein [Betaproteobacteria bacterium]|jgi:uncharacterized protein YciI|nr:YciI family protein [Betaproteobacteria bacterium]
MFYAIIAEDGPDSLGKRGAARDAHLKRMKELQDAGRLLVSGACPAIDSPDPGPAGYSGSLVIAEFESLEAAQGWADADPYVAAGAWSRVTVKPFRKGHPR